MKYKYSYKQKNVRKTLVFHCFTFDQACEIASNLGFTFNEYIRYLVAEDIRRANNNYIAPLSENEKSELSKLLYDIKKGHLRSSREIESIVGRLLK